MKLSWNWNSWNFFIFGVAVEMFTLKATKGVTFTVTFTFTCSTFQELRGSLSKSDFAPFVLACGKECQGDLGPAALKWFSFFFVYAALVPRVEAVYWKVSPVCVLYLLPASNASDTLVANHWISCDFASRELLHLIWFDKLSPVAYFTQSLTSLWL